MVDDTNAEDALASQMASIQKLLEDVTTKLAPLEAAKNEIKNEQIALEAEYRERMASLAKKDNELRELMWDAQREVRKLKQEFESTERQWHQARKVREQMEAFASISDRWDKLTAGAPWREWAKDHQLEAGRRMSWQNKMILADGMGLGKTMSAIIAIDMIKAATAEASPEHPVIFDVEKM